MEIIKISVEELIENDIIANDLYMNNRLLLTRGTIVTNKIISNLRRQEIENIEIYKQLKTIESLKEELENISLPANRKYDLSQALQELNAMERYGKILNRSEDVIYIDKLFAKVTESPLVQNYLFLLQEYDYYTFLHTLDVFILATLFSKKENLENTEDIAVGFMMHDIGKLRIPISILSKAGKLSKAEFKIIQNHTIDGFNLLNILNMSHISYLAKSHHERIDKNGYPEGISLFELPKEVQILQIIDVYSALTLKRVYKNKISPEDAIVCLFQDENLFNRELLDCFTQFIGIYPKDSIVLLSNGSHAIIEQSNKKNPYLPTVREFQTGKSICLEKSSLSILKLLSYNTETSNQFFARLSEFLIDGRKDLLYSYLEKLKDHYRPYEWYTHIHIPLFKVINVLNQNNLLKPEQFLEIKENFIRLLKETAKQLQGLNNSKETVILILDNSNVRQSMVRLLEGLFYSEEISTLEIDHLSISKEIFEEMIYTFKVKRVFMLGRRYDYGIPKRGKIDLYHIDEKMLENFIYGMANECLQKEQFEKRLEKYKVDIQTII